MIWFDLWKAGQAGWDQAIRLGETGVATGSVLRHRGGMIDTALRTPADADVAELGRLVPEKMAAFSSAGAAVFEDWSRLQGDLLAQYRDLGAMMAGGMAGRPPSSAAVERVTQRGSRIMARMAASGGRALAPIHASVTANQRRLDRAARR